MALACKCDRCQKFFPPDDDGKITKLDIYRRSINYLGGGSEIDETYDLCDSCFEDLLSWVNLKKEN